MANPAAPSESGGLKLAFLLADDGAAGNEAILMKSLGPERTAAINGSDDKAGPLVTQVEGEEGELLASAARTASVQSADQTNHGWAGVILYVEVTAVTATPVVTVIIEGKDPSSGVYFPIATYANTLTAVSSRAYMLRGGISEDIAETDLEIQGVPLPKTWRVNMSHADADSITYSVGYSYLS